MKILALLTITALVSNSWAAAYEKCVSPEYTLGIYANTDPVTLPLGVTTNISLIQNFGGVPLMVMTKESVLGDQTTYSGIPGDFKLVIKRAIDEQGNSIGMGTVEGQDVKFVCQ